MPEDVVNFNRAGIEQGSFSDRETGRTYDHITNDEAASREESAMRAGAHVEDRNGVLPSDSHSSTCWNVTSSQVDGQGHEYPTRLSPGD